jgi:hypothetical protein
VQDDAGTDVRSTDFGATAANCNRCAPGADLRPLLAQLPGGDCAVPPWGYVIEGAFTVDNKDGQEHTVDGGQLFSMQPHHVRLTTEDGLLLAESSRADEARGLFQRTATVMQVGD